MKYIFKIIYDVKKDMWNWRGALEDYLTDDWCLDNVKKYGSKLDQKITKQILGLKKSDAEAILKPYLLSLKNNPNSSLVTNYSYSVHYVNGNTDWDGLNLFNPLIFVGFPMSGESVIVEGKLQIKEKEVVLKELRASCVSNKTRNLFQTGGSSGPRKDCLIAVRDNIDTQIKHFKKELSHD